LNHKLQLNREHLALTALEPPDYMTYGAVTELGDVAQSSDERITHKNDTINAFSLRLQTAMRFSIVLCKLSCFFVHF